MASGAPTCKHGYTVFMRGDNPMHPNDRPCDDPAYCPAADSHGNPFRYCQFCSWAEPTAAAEHECCHHVAAARTVLADRERELLELKGACSNRSCRLHYAHSGPCDETGGGRDAG